MLDCAMQNLKLSHNPLIHYRPIRTSDLEVLQKIHGDLFPIRYESEFFQNVVNGRGIVSWGAVDRNRPNGQNDELIGFVTARTVLAKDSDIEDFLRYDSSRSEQTLIYILTLGVADSYKNLGIASSLIHEVIKYASNIPTCRAVYLHVISYNNPAIYLYKKMYFQCVRRLPAFYFINGQHYDAYLFIYYVNGGRSPCSPLELVKLLVTCAKSGFKTMAAKLWTKEERKPSKWPKSKESGSLLPTKHNRRMSTEGAVSQFV
ncbi:histone acetyltransferase MCC1 [Nicotiana sylvestris]|uniref:N-alpha-acetyltransferase 60 n=1 Tax=Nicotiana sylvestris TaxID=4096 RepID=A0A1U7XHH6_NICSY|nr:PREDICTED: histone acetyltransferase MCC1 [Nicotiana sylvestris]XP_009790328.1 PREDICTED: histone acetyltransferase MCC1 [Nicotiana sylvestris]